MDAKSCVSSRFGVIMFFRKAPPQTEGRRDADPRIKLRGRLVKVHKSCGGNTSQFAHFRRDGCARGPAHRWTDRNPARARPTLCSPPHSTPAAARSSTCTTSRKCWRRAENVWDLPSGAAAALRRRRHFLHSMVASHQRGRLGASPACAFGSCGTPTECASLSSGTRLQAQLEAVRIAHWYHTISARLG